MKRKEISLEEAINMLREEYEQAKEMEFVHKPVSYALYQTWARIDGIEHVRYKLETIED